MIEFASLLFHSNSLKDFRYIIWGLNLALILYPVDYLSSVSLSTSAQKKTKEQYTIQSIAFPRKYQAYDG